MNCKHIQDPLEEEETGTIGTPTPAALISSKNGRKIWKNSRLSKARYGFKSGVIVFFFSITEIFHIF